MVNDPDVSMFADYQDINHYYAGDRRTGTLAICIIFIICVTFTTALRFYVRTQLIRAIGSDDYMMLFSVLTFAVFVSFMVVELVYGTGLPRSMLTIPNAEVALEV